MAGRLRGRNFVKAFKVGVAVVVHLYHRVEKAAFLLGVGVPFIGKYIQPAGRAVPCVQPAVVEAVGIIPVLCKFGGIYILFIQLLASLLFGVFAVCRQLFQALVIIFCGDYFKVIFIIEMVAAQLYVGARFAAHYALFCDNRAFAVAGGDKRGALADKVMTGGNERFAFAAVYARPGHLYLAVAAELFFKVFSRIGIFVLARTARFARHGVVVEVRSEPASRNGIGGGVFVRIFRAFGARYVAALFIIYRRAVDVCVRDVCHSVCCEVDVYPVAAVVGIACHDVGHAVHGRKAQRYSGLGHGGCGVVKPLQHYICYGEVVVFARLVGYKLKVELFAVLRISALVVDVRVVQKLFPDVVIFFIYGVGGGGGVFVCVQYAAERHVVFAGRRLRRASASEHEQRFVQRAAQRYVCAVCRKRDVKFNFAELYFGTVFRGYARHGSYFGALFRLFVACLALYAHYGKYELSGVFVAFKAAGVFA